MLSASVKAKIRTNGKPWRCALAQRGQHSVANPCLQSYYQAQKFAGVDTAGARAIYASVRAATTPEAAAKLGRTAQRDSPAAVRPDWERVKVDVMRTALRAKFTQHAAARELLLATGRARLVENSPNDFVWGNGRDGSGRNLLGVLLAELRDELTV
jgi:diaminohydroxyphosphoribosylaminopyrimidine deaminase/5-amino-6-(5-phosphoribosylamino)uracil reductase